MWLGEVRWVVGGAGRLVRVDAWWWVLWVGWMWRLCVGGGGWSPAGGEREVCDCV